jgi:hypothetical protein
MIHLWSTPRTGSTWYAHYLWAMNPGSILINEIFNTMTGTWYFKFDSRGNKLFNLTYEPGCFYYDLVSKNGNLSIIEVYKERSEVTHEDIHKYLDMIHSRNKTVKIIVHNHVTPMHDYVRDFLTKEATENIYLYRRDKRLQLASLAIATATKRFNSYTALEYAQEPVNDIDTQLLKNLIRRIKVWDSIPKESILAFEDIEFVNIPGFKMPCQMNNNHYARISPNMKLIIDDLVNEYEQGKTV